VTVYSVGPHRLRHGDFLEGLGELMGRERADIVVADPPWGQGALSYWLGLNARQNAGEERRHLDHGIFLDHLFALFDRYAKGVVLLEYGQRWRSEMIRRARDADWQPLTVSWRYRSGGRLLSCDLHVLGRERPKLPRAYRERLSELYGLRAVIAAVEPFAVPGGILLDPCCGVGLYARAAVRHGMRFRGNELNLVRLRKTMKALGG
jgi:hypothetical protein